jgi:hypothetical protein
MTFDVPSSHYIGRGEVEWVRNYEAFSICRECKGGTIFIIKLKSYAFRDLVGKAEYWSGNAHHNDAFEVAGFISLKDRVTNEPPAHMPDDIAQVYREGATCASVECFNAAATMFRLCVDIATKPLLPEEAAGDPQPTKHERRNLKPRIEWLLKHQRLPVELGDLLENLREDGNDGAHAGTLSQADADDVADFTHLLLQRLYTDPARLTLARERRETRRAPR